MPESRARLTAFGIGAKALEGRRLAGLWYALCICRRGELLKDLTEKTGARLEQHVAAAGDACDAMRPAARLQTAGGSRVVRKALKKDIFVCLCLRGVQTPKSNGNNKLKQTTTPTK